MQKGGCEGPAGAEGPLRRPLVHSALMREHFIARSWRILRLSVVSFPKVMSSFVQDSQLIRISLAPSLWGKYACSRRAICNYLSIYYNFRRTELSKTFSAPEKCLHGSKCDQKPKPQLVFSYVIGSSTFIYDTRICIYRCRCNVMIHRQRHGRVDGRTQARMHK